MLAINVPPFHATKRDNEQSLRVRLSTLLDRVIFLGLISIITLAAIPYGATDQWWVAIFECIVFALTALWIIHGALNGTWGRIDWRTLAPLVGLLLFAFAQTLPLWPGSGIGHREGSMRSALSADPYETRLWILYVCALSLTGALLIRYTYNERRLKALVVAVVAVGLVSSIFGIMRHMTQLPLPGLRIQALPADGDFGQFFNRNHFALLMEMALGLTAGIIVCGIKRALLLFYLAAALLIWSALVLSNSRGGILGMIGQSLFLMSLWGVARPKSETVVENGRSLDKLQRFGRSLTARILTVVCLMVTLAVGVVWLGGDALMHRLEFSRREIEPENSTRINARRLAIWQATISMIRSNPVAGVGFAGYASAIPAYHDASGSWTPKQAHNDYLELMASGGIIGVVLVAWLVSILGKRAWRRLRLSDNTFTRGSRLGALVGLFGVAVHSLFDFGLHITINALICIALVVIATTAIERKDAPLPL